MVGYDLFKTRVFEHNSLRDECDMLVLDEGHKIRNDDSKTHVTVNSIDTPVRVRWWYSIIPFSYEFQ